ncbi:hypothetical protein CIB48_g2102 [Xylaria polymorpha]|nr:hypothetical protein CIB48_g2102 [Xylaria polymorpha]
MAPQPKNRGEEAEALDPRCEAPAPDHNNQRQPRPAVSGTWLSDDSRPETIAFRYSPDPSKDAEVQDWEALLLAQCRDVPLLMGEGFYWGSDNVVNEDGFINGSIHTMDQVQRMGTRWTGSRHYYLKDLQQPPRWVAMLQVYAVLTETLHHFDLSQLSWNKITNGTAVDRADVQIYQYYHGKPDDCFNYIYGYIPLEGDWPWPREDAGDQVDGTAVAETETEMIHRGVKRKYGED